MATKTETEIDRSVAAAERTLAILDAFLDEDGPLKLKDIEEKTGLFRSVILRYMLSLERLHYIYRRADGRYQLGSRLFQLGKSYQQGFQLSAYVLPALSRLVASTGETASFYVREGDSRLCLFRENSPQALRVSVKEGRVIPLNVASTDLVLKDFDEGLGYGNGAPDSLTRRTSGVVDAWTSSISAPVLGEANALIGALTISGPTQRFDIHDLATHRLLVAEALRIAASLGCPSVPNLD